MAVDSARIADIVRGTVDLYRAAEAALLRLITSYLDRGMESPRWAQERLAALGALRNAAQDILAQLLADAQPEIATAVAEAYREGGAAVLTELTADAAAGLAAQAALEVVPRVAPVESLAAALVSDVGVKHSNVLRDVLDVYRKVITQATSASIAGGITRREASQLAYARFVDRGVTGFTDVRGRRWRLSSYVEMAVRTVTQRAAIQGQTDRQTRLGLPYVMVSNEAQECALCRPYEGRVLRVSPGPTGRIQVQHQTTGKPVTIDVKATLEAARAAGFQHPNCRHSVRAYMPGITKLPRQPTADPEGDKARQQQRYLERGIRRWKERETAALTPEARAQARAKVRAWQAAMRQHLADNPALKRLSYREQIGAGNIPAPSTTAPTPAKKPAKAAKPAAPKPPTVPAPDQPFMRNLDGVEDLAATVQSAGTGAKRTKLLGGQSATTELVTTSDGTKLVHKQGMDWGDPDEVAAEVRRQADAEHLTSLLGRAIGAPVVPVYRDSADAVWMPFLPGTVIGDAPNVEELLASRDGILLGLLDHLAANADRNSGNILVHNGQMTGIDHGFAFGEQFFSDALPVAQDGPNRPAWHFSRDGAWVDNPLTAHDVTELGRRMEALRPDFDQLDRGAWLDYSLRILEILGQHARGTEDRIV